MGTMKGTLDLSCDKCRAKLEQLIADYRDGFTKIYLEITFEVNGQLHLNEVEHQRNT